MDIDLLPEDTWEGQYNKSMKLYVCTVTFDVLNRFISFWKSRIPLQFHRNCGDQVFNRFPGVFRFVKLWREEFYTQLRGKKAIQLSLSSTANKCAVNRLK